MNVGFVRSRSLPGRPLIWNETPPPGLLVGSGKSWNPWLRMHVAYASNCTSTD